MTMPEITAALLSERLKTETAAHHERMHALMGRANVFASRAAYARFVAVQYLFLRDVEHLLGKPGVMAVLCGLDLAGRSAAARQDLSDLGAGIPDEPVSSSGVGMPAALGWLYVSEGSTLGAAFLLKEAGVKLGLSETFGARNLAPRRQGRAAAWHRFVALLDGAGLGAGDQDEVVDGARAAFERFASLLARELPA